MGLWSWNTSNISQWLLAGQKITTKTQNSQGFQLTARNFLSLMQEEEEEESKTGSNVTLHDSSWTGMVHTCLPCSGCVSV